MSVILGLSAALLQIPFPIYAEPSGSVASVSEEQTVRFVAERHTLWLGRTQVIPFRLAEAVDADMSLAARLSDEECLEILKPPEVLAGRDLGYLRVRARTLGETELRIGSASVRIEVRKPRNGSATNTTEVRIVTPVAGAAVWGEFSVGVELRPGVDAGRNAAQQVRLCLPDGRKLTPVTHTKPNRGPHLQLRFDVDAAALPVGRLDLYAELEPSEEDATSSHSNSTKSELEAVKSKPIAVRVLRPDSKALVKGECEAYVSAERPQAFGERLPWTGSDTKASGGVFVSNTNPDPTWILPFEVPRTGRYQMMVVARGDYGAGAFPSVGFCVDDPNQNFTSVRLTSRQWHRVPVGYPVELDSGSHHVGLRYLNDSQVSTSTSRNLFLDRFELLRLPDEAAAIPALGEGAGQEMGMDMEGGAMTASGSSGLEGDSDLWIAFDQVFDRQPAQGLLILRGHCNWQDAQTSAAPQVELELNGTIVARQQAARPTFALDRDDFVVGPNQVRLIATLADGTRAETPQQTLMIEEPIEALPPREAYRFSVLDERWDDALKATLTNQNQETGHRVAQWQSGTRAQLELPDDLEGEYELFVDARGPDGGPYVELELTLHAGELDVTVGQARVQNWWNHREVGRVTLGKGPKTLELALTDASAAAFGNDMQLLVRDVVLRTPRAEVDRVPPRAHLRYPEPGHEAWQVDAVIVEAWDDDGLRQADVLVDGRPQATFCRLQENSAGYLHLPLLLRDVEPGVREIAVRVIDRAGNVAETAPISIRVLEQAPPEKGRYARAIHLLNRLAYGPDSQELAALLLKGEEAWLNDRIREPGAGDQAARDFGQALRGKDRYYDINRSTLAQVLRTNNPVLARFAFWIDNHFSTWIGKTTNGAEWWEHTQFHELGFAPFAEYLMFSATSPVMIYYLDQMQSYAGRLNENYAREVMELHTLGVDGGYSQEEVTTLAGLLCGLTIAFEAPADGDGGQVRGDFAFDPDLGDARERSILGMRFARCDASDRYDRFRLAIEVLAAHPNTARFVTHKFVEHYVSVPAPEGLVEDLSAVFLEEGGDMGAMLRALVRHPEFWQHDEPRMTSPFDFAVRLGRTTGVTAIDWALGGFLRRSGMSLYDRVTPDGYPEEDSAWIDTNGLVQRWRLVQQLPWAVRQLVPDALRGRSAGDQEAWRQRVIDLAAVRLTGWTLGEDSNQAALEFLAAESGPPWQAVDNAAVLVCRLPEANMK